MKSLLSILFLSALATSAFTQTDTILVENLVKFYKYSDATYKNVDAIGMTLQVTNHTEHPIPDLGVSNRSQYVKLYINEKDANPISIYNGIEAIRGKKTIAVDSTQTFDLGGWLLTRDSGILTHYGNEFTVQWEYMKMRSKVVRVNIEEKTIEMVE